MRNLRAVAALALMVTQLLLIAYARTTPARYFCWAPFDQQTDYTLDVIIDGRRLNAQEIRQRYRRPARGTDNRSVQNLIDIVEGYEQRYAGSERAQIVMHYRINGKQEQTWTYPNR